jgi:hypothetical protein
MLQNWVCFGFVLDASLSRVSRINKTVSRWCHIHYARNLPQNRWVCFSQKVFFCRTAPARRTFLPPQAESDETRPRRICGRNLGSFLASFFTKPKPACIKLGSFGNSLRFRNPPQEKATMSCPRRNFTHRSPFPVTVLDGVRRRCPPNHQPAVPSNPLTPILTRAILPYSPTTYQPALERLKGVVLAVVAATLCRRAVVRRSPDCARNSTENLPIAHLEPRQIRHLLECGDLSPLCPAPPHYRYALAVHDVMRTWSV